MNRKHMRITRPIMAVLALSCASACGGEDPKTPEDLDERIIGGFPARSPRFDAVGALGFSVGGAPEFDTSDPATSLRNRRPYLREREIAFDHGDEYFPFCSGTLIAPNAVLTAEHCVQGLFGDEEFLIGFDATSPKRHIPIVGVVAEDSIQGGFIGLGSDVAVAILAEPVTDIEPLAYAQLTESDVGTPGIGLGYGVRNNFGDAGQRYLGQMSIRGIGGNHALNIWETFEAYAEQFPNIDPGFGLGDDPQAALPFFDLIDEYEASIGAAAGDAQDCYGDSGGPITKRGDDGKLTVLGVVSGGIGTQDLICDWGGVYATLGPAAKQTVDVAVGCGLVPVEGACDGSIVSRCIPPEEGGYQVAQTDCSLLGLVCGLDDAGEIGCIPDPCEGIPEEGTCDGEVAVRCSTDGPREVTEIDCGALGGSCGFDESDQVTCVGLPGGTCQGNCGGSAEGPDGSLCFCDSVCSELGDCCADYELWCDPEDPVDPTDTEGGVTSSATVGGSESTSGVFTTGGDDTFGSDATAGESGGSDTGAVFIVDPG